MADPHPTKPILDQGYDGVVAMLSDFGYSGVTVPMVNQSHANWKAGKQPEDIIERFSFDAFDRYPHIFGEKEPVA